MKKILSLVLAIFILSSANTLANDQYPPPSEGDKGIVQPGQRGQV
ncbi:hypothetical protein GCM10008967_04700 [Bacillus carboniphilus]|uniref:Uncharacterized protein n=1 Tax=Bacillus carboniphilus TaxID=86663 RepID=A0ABP3FIV6_9BACI